MNFQETLQQMLDAGAAAAKGHWKALRGHAEQEFRRLGEAAAWLEADYLADLAAAQLPSTKTKRAKMESKAKLRAKLAFDNLTLAAEGVVTAAKGDAKLAAQDAINAALAVARAAVNKSVGIALL